MPPTDACTFCIKVAKLRTGVGSAVSKYQGRCEQRSEVFVKTFFFFLEGGGSGRGGGGRGHRVDVNKFFVKI